MAGKGKHKPGKQTADTPVTADDANPFVSRGGLKLRCALDAFGADAFGLDVSGLWCADLGCSTGGFSDCLLQGGAARVFAVDTAYGELAWKIRTDERVTVMERTNAVHAQPPTEVLERGGVDLVVIDLGWTPQSRAIPAALRWVVPNRPLGQSLIQGPGASPGSPANADGLQDNRVGENAGGGEPGLARGPCMEHRPAGRVVRIVSLIKPHYEVDKLELGERGVLNPVRAAEVTEEVCAAMPGLGVRVLGCAESPITGGKKKGKGTGNKEWLALLEPVD